MRSFNHYLTGILYVTFFIGSVTLMFPPPSQADVEIGGIKNVLKKIFPPCGPGTRKERFVVKGEKVCDNKSGLWWEQSPSTDNFMWEEANQHCEDLTISGHPKKQWRLAEVKELITLVDYSVFNQAANLNAPNGPFANVLTGFYWSVSEFAASPTTIAWTVNFADGGVRTLTKDTTILAWCVSGGQDAH